MERRSRHSIRKNILSVLVALPSALVPLVIMGTSSASKAEELKPRQLIAQSCRNIEIRTSGNNRDFRRGAQESTCGYRFNFQQDGNLVLSNSSGQVLWATGTEGRGEILSMQSDGNLVIYGAGRPLWATNTNGNPGAFLAIQGDGNLVIYARNGRQALWSSSTDGGKARTPNQSSNPKWADRFNSFVSQNKGSRMSDLGGSYPGQCVSLVKQWGASIGRGQGRWPGGYPKEAFDAYKNGNISMVGTDSNTSIVSDWHQLQAGDIVIMKGYPSHTGIASGKMTGPQYEMFDQNSPQGSSAKLQMYNSSQFIGAIRYN
jgi:hypothetical protein